MGDDDWRSQLPKVEEREPRPKRSHDQPRPSDGGAGGQGTPMRDRLRRVWERKNPQRRTPDEG